MDFENRRVKMWEQLHTVAKNSFLLGRPRAYVTNTIYLRIIRDYSDLFQEGDLGDVHDYAENVTNQAWETIEHENKPPS